MEKQEGTHVELWEGDPVFWTPSHMDTERTSRVFHRDRPGWLVAEFYGPTHREMADRFCQLFGEQSGHPAN